MNEIIIKGDWSPDAIDFFKNAGRIAASELDLTSDPDELPDVVKAAFERAPIAAALAKSGTHAYVSLDLSVPQSDVDEDWRELDKGLLIVKTAPAPIVPNSGYTSLGKKLGVVRQTICEIDGLRQLHGFNAAGELVDFRVLLPGK